MRNIEVDILGQRYKIRSDEDEEYIQRLANYLCEKINEVQESSKTVATHNVVVLAALNIADHLFKIEKKSSLFKKEVEERIRRILMQIRKNQSDE